MTLPGGNPIQAEPDPGAHFENDVVYSMLFFVPPGSPRMKSPMTFKSFFFG
jgi:hypothetical protein